MALGVSITDELSGFAEFFGDAGLSRSGGPRNSFDTGLTYLLQDNLQLDFAGGIGLSEEADDWFITAGFSYRWPQ